MENKNLSRFLLTFFLGWIGSLIINNTNLRKSIGKKGYKTSLEYTTEKISKQWLELLEKS